MADVYLGLGSNLGDRRKLIAAALAGLSDFPDTRVVAKAGDYETEPCGGPSGQGNYLNSACRLATDLPPLPFLAALQNLEKELGRIRGPGEVRWGPRTIDLDILLWDDVVIDTAELTLPHPRLPEREFVLLPLVEIAPDVRHPVLGLTMRELLERLEQNDAGI